MPDKIGKYTIKSELGRGAMGVVYWAEDTRLRRSVALKTMSASVAQDPELLKRFYREAQSAGQLCHANIVTIYDIDEADGTPFIAMEFLQGDALEKMIASRREMPVVDKLDIIIQACEGLHYAHEHGIIHRDIKPANIMVMTNGTVKLVDFGIARISSSSMTQKGSVMGTPMYMSPEQIMGKTVDRRTDIFSLGVVLYETLTFENPFRNPDISAVLYRIVNEEPPPLSKFIPNCPPDLERAQRRALAKNRDQRYETALDFAIDLREIVAYLKQYMIEIYVQEGERALELGDLTLAKDSLRRVLEIDSTHNLAKNLLNKVQEQINARQRTQNLEKALRSGAAALQAERYKDAIAQFEIVLHLDPDNETAQQQKRFAAQQVEVQEKIARHMQRAETLVARADHQGAKSELESVLTLDPRHSSALLMMESVLKELEDRARQIQVKELTESARNALNERDVNSALKLLEEAALLDPVNPQIESLMRQARHAMEKEEGRKRLNERLAQIQEAISGEQIEQALALAESALLEFPDESRVHKLHDQAAKLVETQRRQQFIDGRLQAAHQFLQQNQFSEATALLEQALQSFPDDARLASFLKSVQDAQQQASLEVLRQEAVQKANEQIRAKDFSGAIDTLERALVRVGRMQDLVELLDYAREQQSELSRQERLTQLLSRAQTLLRKESFDEAIRTLERGQEEIKGGEIASLLASARQQQQQFEKRREEIAKRALQLIEAGEANKAVAHMETAPQTYFKNEDFQKVYAQCREAVVRASVIRETTAAVEKLIAAEEFAQAQAALVQVLATYPDDPALLAARQHLADEAMRSRLASLRKALDDARASIGRMQFKEAIASLSAVDWSTAGDPKLASEAQSLVAEARRKEELAHRQTQPVIPPPQRPPQRESRLRAGALDKSASVPEMPETVMTRDLPPRSAMPPATSPAAGVSASAAPGVSPPLPKAAPPAVAPLPAPVVKRATPIPAPAPAAAKGTPMAVWAGAALLALVLIGFVIWRIVAPHGGTGNATAVNGYVELIAAPRAQVVSVQTAAGKDLNKTGETPLLLELPSGDYVVELKNGTQVEKVPVSVEAGKTVRSNNVLPQAKIDDIVNDLVANY